MKIKIIEVTNGPNQNWGKMLLGRFDSEWEYKSAIPTATGRFPLLAQLGWGPDHILVLDLATGEGSIFFPGGSAPHDLKKHAVWVCPMFEPFLQWLYQQDTRNLDKLPAHVDIPEAEFSMTGYRRPGPLGDAVRLIKDLMHGSDRANRKAAKDFLKTLGEES